MRGDYQAAAVASTTIAAFGGDPPPLDKLLLRWGTDDAFAGVTLVTFAEALPFLTAQPRST